MWTDFNLSGHVFSVIITFASEITIKNDEERYSRLGKMLGNLYRELKDNDIELLDGLIHLPDSSIHFSTNSLGGHEIDKKGPPTKLQENAEKFKLNNDQVWIEHGYYWAKTRQKTVTQIIQERMQVNPIIKSFKIQSYQ